MRDTGLIGKLVRSDSSTFRTKCLLLIFFLWR
jgi:hypothetical protein